jgi:uncharacterized protein YjbJ (UPF0337 family)
MLGVKPLWNSHAVRRSGCHGRSTERKETVMALGDKISNAAEDLAGKAKEAAGKAKGDERLEAEGQGDQTKAQAKKVGEDVKDVFR